MHQRSRHAFRSGRLVRGLLASAVVAIALTVATGPVGWSPLCVLYEPWSFLWIWNQCWDAPPHPPEG